ncbi:MAG: DNA polymerase III subunit gamma/tau [Deltaproteobacteria bacterium]|nr:DNA polymerase III subunit gamma/tau [Deltaproteobacteria bacterium]
MSYIVLARKWRPQTFADLTGQDHVTRTLTNAIHLQRVPHAMLFTGARGVGKTSSARIIAMALNCVSGPTPSPCGSCDACTEIQRGSSVDVIEIDGASNRGIGEIRELRDGVRYAPQRDRNKIYIIDEVHMLTTEAFNALLKTLEEPPPNVHFIFATTEVHKIPVTILSRCQRFDFRRISHADIVARLSYIVEQEKLEIPAEVLHLVARQAAGGMRDALSQLDQIIAFAGPSATVEQVAPLLGAAERSRLFAISRALLDKDLQLALETVDEIAAYGGDMGHFAEQLIGHFRDLTVVAVSTAPERLTSLSDAEIAEARGQVEGRSSELLHRMFEELVQSSEAITRSLFPKLLLEMALIRLCAMEPVVRAEELIARFEALAGGHRSPPSGSSGGPAPTRAAAPAAPAEPPPRPVARHIEGPIIRPPAPPMAPAIVPTAMPVAPPAPVASAAATAEADDHSRLIPPPAEAPPLPTPEIAAPSPIVAAPPAQEEPAPEVLHSRLIEAPLAAPPLPAAAQADAPSDAQDDEFPEPDHAPWDEPAGATAVDADKWRAWVATVRERDTRLGQMMALALFVPATAGELRLAYAPHMQKVVKPHDRALIEQACIDLAGGPVSVRWEVTTEVSEEERTGGISVILLEEAEALSRKTMLADNVRNHLSTQLLIGAWPQGRLEIRIQDRLEQDAP